MTTYTADLTYNPYLAGAPPYGLLHTLYQLCSKAPGSTTTLTGKTPATPTANFATLTLTIPGSPAGTTTAQLQAGTAVDQWLAKSEDARQSQRQIAQSLFSQNGNVITISTNHYSVFTHVSNFLTHRTLCAAAGQVYDDVGNPWPNQDYITPP